MRGHFFRQNAAHRPPNRPRQFLFCMTALVSLLLLPLTGCASQEATRECFAMDTVMNLSAYGDHAETALADVETELYRLDRLFSISSSTGDIAKLNRSGSATVSDETAKLLQRALTLSQETDGALDITLYPVSQLWGFYSGDFQVPTSSQIQTALQTVGRDHCHLNGTSVTLDKGTQLDLGANRQRLCLLPGCAVADQRWCYFCQPIFGRKCPRGRDKAGRLQLEGSHH